MTNPQPDPREAMEQGRAAARLRYGLDAPAIPAEMSGMVDSAVNRGRLAAVVRHGSAEHRAAADALLADWDSAREQQQRHEEAMKAAAWQHAGYYGAPPQQP